jgi:hemerythrin-like domain-containing protein
MRVIDDLKAEHGLIRRVLVVMETEAERMNRGDEPRYDVLTGVLSFAREFADGCHHRKEEDYLFPALADKSEALQYGPVRVMLAEHDEGRRHLRDLDSGIEGLRSGDEVESTATVAALRHFSLLLRGHIEKEEGILFQIAAQILSPEDDYRLGEGFDSVEAEKGAGAHERFHALVDLLESTPV